MNKEKQQRPSSMYSIEVIKKNRQEIRARDVNGSGEPQHRMFYHPPFSQGFEICLFSTLLGIPQLLARPSGLQATSTSCIDGWFDRQLH